MSSNADKKISFIQLKKKAYSLQGGFGPAHTISLKLKQSIFFLTNITSKLGRKQRGMEANYYIDTGTNNGTPGLVISLRGQRQISGKPAEQTRKGRKQKQKKKFNSMYSTLLIITALILYRLNDCLDNGMSDYLSKQEGKSQGRIIFNSIISRSTDLSSL